MQGLWSRAVVCCLFLYGFAQDPAICTLPSRAILYCCVTYLSCWVNPHSYQIWEYNCIGHISWFSRLFFQLFEHSWSPNSLIASESNILLNVGMIVEHLSVQVELFCNHLIFAAASPPSSAFEKYFSASDNLSDEFPDSMSNVLGDISLPYCRWSVTNSVLEVAPLQTASQCEPNHFSLFHLCAGTIICFKWIRELKEVSKFLTWIRHSYNLIVPADVPVSGLSSPCAHFSYQEVLHSNDG